MWWFRFHFNTSINVLQINTTQNNTKQNSRVLSDLRLQQTSPGILGDSFSQIPAEIPSTTGLCTIYSHLELSGFSLYWPLDVLLGAPCVHGVAQFRISQGNPCLGEVDLLLQLALMAPSTLYSVPITLELRILLPGCQSTWILHITEIIQEHGAS